MVSRTGVLSRVLSTLSLILAIIVTVLMSFFFVFGMVGLIIAIDAYVLMHLWPLVVPQLFPGAVASGAVAGEVTFMTMFYGLVAIMVLKPADLSRMFSKIHKKGDKNDNK